MSPQHGRIVRPNGTECFRRYYWFGLHSLKQFSASQHNLLTNSLAGRLLFNAADWPAYRPIKSPSPVSFNRAVNIDCAGKGRGSSFSCSSSVVSRFWINRAGFPVTNLVTKVFSSVASDNTLRCSGWTFASSLLKKAVPIYTALAPSMKAAAIPLPSARPPAAIIGTVTLSTI